MAPHRHTTCHGNWYPVWNRAQLAQAQSEKQLRVQAAIAETKAREERELAALMAQKERALEEVHGGAASLAAHRDAEAKKVAAHCAAEAKKEEKNKQAARAERLRAEIASLEPGRRAPAALPLCVTSRVAAKKGILPHRQGPERPPGLQGRDPVACGSQQKARRQGVPLQAPGGC